MIHLCDGQTDGQTDGRAIALYIYYVIVHKVHTKKKSAQKEKRKKHLTTMISALIICYMLSRAKNESYFVYFHAIIFILMYFYSCIFNCPVCCTVALSHFPCLPAKYLAFYMSLPDCR